MIQIEIDALNLEQVFDQYYPNPELGYSGFLTPKEEYIDLATYISSYKAFSETDYIKMILLDINLVPIECKKLNSNYFIGIGEKMTFSFPDEETALYYKLKFWSIFND